MKAVVLKDNACLEVEDMVNPPPLPDECTIEVGRVGVCSSDIARSHHSGAYFYPLVMGHELAGTVIAVGKGVDRLSLGDRVAVFPLLPCFECSSCTNKNYAQCYDYDYYGSRRNGGFAEALNVKAWNLIRIPENVNLDDAALTEPTAVVVHSIDRLFNSVKQPKSELLIIGAGFLGLLAIDVLRLMYPGLKITIVDRNAYKLKYAADLGAKTIEVINAEEWEELIIKRSDGFSYVLEASGTPEGFRNAIRLARRGGAVCWMGNISGDLMIKQKEVSDILRREITIVGTWNSSFQGQDPSDWTLTLNLMAEGLRPSRFVSHRVDLNGVAESLIHLADPGRRRTGGYIKVMVENNYG